MQRYAPLPCRLAPIKIRKIWPSGRRGDGLAGWSVWAFNERKDHIAVIRFINNIDQKTVEDTTGPVKVDADANFTLRFPLNAQTIRTQIVSIPYGYQSGQRGKRIDGALELIPSDMGEWRPLVVFKNR